MRHQERSWCARKWSHKLPPLFSLLEPPPYHPPLFVRFCVVARSGETVRVPMSRWQNLSL
jgi:hypothetical protein